MRLATREQTDGRRILNYAWTSDNLLASVTGPDPSQTTGTVVTLANEYDGTGRTVRAVDANGNVSATTYTADGLVRRTADSLGANGLKHVLSYDYDHDGNRTCAATLAQADQLKTQTGRPQNGTTVGIITNAYDAALSMTSTTDRRPDGSTHTVTATYYADQLLRDVADGAPRTGYAYYGAGTLTARAEGPTAGPAVRTENTVRNDAGLPAATDNPLEGSGTKAEWAYDPAGRLKTETRRSPQGVRTQDFVRAGDDLLTGTTVHSGSSTAAPTLASWQYTHDNAGRILTQAFTGQAAATSAGGTAGQPVADNAPVTYRFDYDHAGRLSSFADARGRRTVRR